MLRATAACTFSTSQLPKVLRTWCVLHILTSKCATSISAPKIVCFVHFDFEICFAPQRRAIFFISHLARWLRTRHFSEPTFRPSGFPQWVTTFLSFPVPASSFSWLFSSLIFSLLLFSSHLCFSICPYCRSKLPSTIP